ncbi:hypothetical protein A3J20_01365 [Candidatus Gottesmanbacteria bacterium RIFCSPLOWO2_02_FULL_42_29]|nr:MAG: GntR family transcriptional regulator [Candidatus Gottesmanbacteria bacterium GW2011_GWC2_42_8]OGG38217.1 MAG: hypothetical protein A3J20_01365 [Candidatus Gottesmanbacteria bacterium RIFCSPLOWO2_02_FULL_42_29]
MINYEAMANGPERETVLPVHLQPLTLTPTTIYRAVDLNIQTELKPRYSQPPNLLSLIGLVSEMKRQGIEVDTIAGGLPPEAPLDYLWREHFTITPFFLREEYKAFHGLQYAGAEGNFELRTWVAEDISKLSGKTVTEKNILTLPGSQYGLATSLVTLCESGKKVALTSTPTYSAFMQAAEYNNHIPVIAVESDEHGMLPDKLEETITTLLEKGYDIGLTYEMVYKNPSGGVLTDERGKKLNGICKSYGIPLLLDYAYYKLSKSDNPPNIDYLDKNIILVFTASKLYAPAERVAWATILGDDLYKKLKSKKEADMIMTPARTELEFFDFAQTELENKTPSLVERYNEGIDKAMEAINQHEDIFRAIKPEAGMFVWVEVPPGLSTYANLGRILQEQKIAYAPGAWFQPRQIRILDGSLVGIQPVDNFFRGCAVTEEPEKIFGIFNRLAGIFREIAKEQNIKLFDIETKSQDVNSNFIFQAN